MCVGVAYTGQHYESSDISLNLRMLNVVSLACGIVPRPGTRVVQFLLSSHASANTRLFCPSLLPPCNLSWVDKGPCGGAAQHPKAWGLGLEGPQ